MYAVIKISVSTLTKCNNSLNSNLITEEIDSQYEIMNLSSTKAYNCTKQLLCTTYQITCFNTCVTLNLTMLTRRDDIPSLS